MHQSGTNGLMQHDRTFLISGCLALVMAVAMTIHGHALITPATPWGILNLELARTLPGVESVLDSWKQLSDTAMWNTLMDFSFLAAYSWFFFCGMRFIGILAVRNGASWPSGLTRKLSRVPGVLDAIENFFLLGWLLNLIPEFSPGLVWLMVCIKFALAAMLLLFCLPAWLYNFWLLIKKA